MSATIRRATVRDAEEAAALWAQLQTEHTALDPRHSPSASARTRWLNDVRVWVTSDAHRVVVAEEGGRLVGLITAHTYWPSPMYEQEMEVYVTELVVAPDARGGGVGARLLDEVRAWARTLGVRQLRAGVLSANHRARAFWAREGADEFYTTVTLAVRAEGSSDGVS